MTLTELQRLVKRRLDEAFPLPVWVVAEISEMKVNYSGHCYLELVEKGGADSIPQARANAVIWRTHFPSIATAFRMVTGSELAVGLKVLLKVVVSYHELYGFSLQVNDIDPSYTLGDWEQQRQQTIAQLQADGVFDMNRELEMPLVLQRIAVVSSRQAAGFRDFMQELDRAPYRFRITLFDAFMQGAGAESSIVEALEAIAARMEEFDAVVMIRGGGSQSDLSCFNSYRLCSHVAQFPLPVLTGIGHDKDQSVADMVAARMLKTPTAVATFLVEEMAQFDAWLDGRRAEIETVVSAWLQHQRERLERAAQGTAEAAVGMTRRMELRLERLQGELVRRKEELLIRSSTRLSMAVERLRERTAHLFERQRERIAAAEKIVAVRRPEQILRLGFAIVRMGGRAVHEASALHSGDEVTLTLGRGERRAKITDHGEK
mgnify:CR=1 FL=1